MSEVLHYQTLSATCRQLKSGALSASELTDYMLKRISACEPQLSSYAMVLEEQARQQAAQLDRAQKAGEPLGPLHGVPVAVKDLLYTRGHATASGTRVMANFIPEFDATVVLRLRDAGAVIIGKTQLTEGAFGAHHPDIVAPRNPYDVNRWPGVSSSGSGVSVAAGLAFAALGTDTGGSIRFPSASCGLVGIKPTYGRVSRHGAFALAESLDHIGPMCRSVEDAARILSVIAGQDPQDPTSLPDDVPNYPALALPRDLTGFVIGVDWDYANDGVDEEVHQVMQRVARQLQDLGGKIKMVTLPGSYRRLVDEWGITCAVECARAHRAYYPARADQYGPVLSQLLELGLSVPQGHYEELEAVRANFRTELDDLFSGVDLLLTPCMTSLPLPVAQMDENVATEDGRASFITFTAPYDYSGHPTITLPAGLSANGLPESFQLVGKRLGEAALIRAGFAYEHNIGPMPHPPV